MDPPKTAELSSTKCTEQSIHEFSVEEKGHYSVTHEGSEADYRNFTNRSSQVTNSEELSSNSVLETSLKSNYGSNNVHNSLTDDTKVEVSAEAETKIQEGLNTEEEHLLKLKSDGCIQDGSLNLKSDDNISCHQQPSYTQQFDSVNPNYFVLVENPDGSQVMSTVIPNLLPSDKGGAQIALNAVLQAGISYVDSNVLNEGKDTVFPSETVTMIIDPNLYSQDPQNIYAQQSSIVDITGQSITSGQTAVSQRNEGEAIIQEIPVVRIDGSSSSVQLETVEFPSQMSVNKLTVTDKDVDQVASDWDSRQSEIVNVSFNPNINLAKDTTSSEMKEAENKLKEKQRQLDLRKLEQSHLQHQEELQLRRTVLVDQEQEIGIKIDDAEEMLNKVGIDDNTPIFSHISTKINPNILLYIPGCKDLLVNEAAKKNLDVRFLSDLDCSFSGDIKDLITLYNDIKNQMKLLSPSKLFLGRCKEDKNCAFYLSAPYVTSKGRLSKQSDKLLQMKRLHEFDEDIGSDENEAKVEVKRKKRRQKRHLNSKTYKKQQSYEDFNPTETELESCTEVDDSKAELKIGSKEFESLYSLCDGEEINRDIPKSTVINEVSISLALNVEDAVPVELEEVGKKGEHEDELTTSTILENEPRQKEDSDLVPSFQSTSSIKRTTRGRPPAKFDPTETLTRMKVKPRDPLMESEKTKKRRAYEEKASFKFFCDHCSFKSKRQSQFTQHLALHEKGDEIKHYCQHCDFISMSVASLKVHELIHKKNLLKCNICTVYATDNKKLMNKHMRLKHSVKVIADTKYTCQVCSATFKTRSFLNKHISMHRKSKTQTPCADNVPRLSCPDCKKSFGRKIYLQRHIKHVHGPEHRPHLCDLCGMSFKRKDALEQHRVVHAAKATRVLPFKCTVCDKAFRSKAHLNEHAPTHSSDRPFLCQYCGASFKTQPVQKRHIMRLHIQPRTHVCRACCRQFNSKSALQKHESSHKSTELRSRNEVENPWATEMIGIKKIDNNETVRTNNMMVSMEGEQATTALVVKTDTGTQMMVDSNLVPTMIAPTEVHLSGGAGTLKVQQALLQNGDANQAFYYIADSQLQNIQ